uniref:DUF4772 domain-containing protein n=1 Tax=Arion vulgaris TaxID=1028688 RepID=A0A0B7AS88_9EUPU
MFWTKKLAKRSIIGTRVSALWPQDGRYYPGIVQSQVYEETITADAVYDIIFDDGFTHHIKSRNVVGPGFQQVTSTVLKRGQKVFLTLNGREVNGVVLHHNHVIDEVVVKLRNQNGEDYDTTRRLEEIRLLESRKSARLVDHADTDYSKLADLQLNVCDSHIISKRRIPSNVIDVPSPSFEKHNIRRRRRQGPLSVEFATDHRGALSDLVSMDETVAALVLTSLSVSPASPSWTAAYIQSGNIDSKETYCPYPDSHLSSSVASGGFFRGYLERGNHSPPLMLPPLSESAPATMEYKLPITDDDDDNPENSSQITLTPTCQENDATIYKCTWRGCCVMTTTRNKIERHIRRDHFHRDSDIELTDNEEDFHYTEMDANHQAINTMTKSFAALNTLSPNEKISFFHKNICNNVSNAEKETVIPCESETGHGSNNGDSLSGSCPSSEHGEERISDPDYLIKDLTAAFSSNETTSSQGQTTPLSVTADKDQIKKSLSWQSNCPSLGVLISPSQRSSKPTPQERLSQHQAQSPKSNTVRSTFKVTQHRRTRSEVRKCRKVYGMENRELWCTQCKWKKACTKFID